MAARFELTTLTFKLIEKLRKIARSWAFKGLRKGIEIGREKGREEGVEEGTESSRYDIAKRLKKKGMPNEIIADTTGLTIEA